jgi:hypothetical protein
MAIGKNLHLEHLEDEIINLGSEGGKKAIQILRDMGEYLSGSVTGKLKVTTKWDGAPAVVCGIDPTDNTFFVGTKSVFAKTEPKICKTKEDIQKLYNGELASKLMDCLTYLPKCVTKGVLQGDLMFTNDKKMENIQKEKLITFRPNTITYAVEPDSPLGRQIAKAKLGIVFHTKYTGKTLPEMTSSFNVSKDDFKENPNVWIEKAEFTDISGIANFSSSEKTKYDAAVNRAEGSLKQCSQLLNKIQTGKRTLEIDTEFKKFFNAYVRVGQQIPSKERALVEFAHHLGKEYDKVIKTNKTLEAQAKKAGKWVDMIEFIDVNKRQMEMLIAAYMNLQAAKNILVNKLKAVSSLRLFVNRGDHYEATNPEGFVAISGDKATKLVDRLEFSKNNFTVPKQW